MSAEMKGRIQVQKNKAEEERTKMFEVMEDREKFEKILDRCIPILSNVMACGGNIFELLDPLISDTQCHIHSLLILSALHKCYDRDEIRYRDLSELEDEDMKILSHAVLFSLLKIRYVDEFGVAIRETSICDFDSLLFPSRKRERSIIDKARQNFNLCSVNYLKRVASEKTEEILNACEVTSSKSGFRFLPCYASLHAILDCLRKLKLPIIISLISIKPSIEMGGDTILELTSTEVRFYEFRGDGKDFVFKKDLNESERNVPTIAFECYSVANNGTANVPADYDIADLLLLCAASDVQLPKKAVLIPNGYQDGEDYVRSLYEKNKEISDGYNRHYELCKKYDIINASYHNIVDIADEHGGEGISIAIERRKKDAFFAIDHVNVSNYSRQCERLRSLQVGKKIAQKEVLRFNKNRMTMEAFKRLGLQTRTTTESCVDEK